MDYRTSDASANIVTHTTAIATGSSSSGTGPAELSVPGNGTQPSTRAIFSADILNSPTVDAMVSRLCAYMPAANCDLVRQSYALAYAAHGGQYRQSGEAYINHPVAVACILLDMQMDAETIAAALLHDVIEDTSIDQQYIEELFGAEIAHLVDGVTKLSVLEMKSKEEAQAGTYRKMFIAMANDPRVVLIKLADRLHNMRTLDATPPEKQHRIARETLDIYAPLAHRLGIWQIKSELEDLAFKIIDPQKYREIARQLMLRRDVRQRIVQRVISKLEHELEHENIAAKVTGRPKHIYSIYRKMERKGVSLEQIYDQMAVRIIVNEVGECYRALGIVHNMWTPIMSEFDDYIAVPKESMYRSLHTTVLMSGGTPCEVQIRTQDMHEVAERGIAAHWRYKEGFRKDDKSFEAKLSWLRSLIEWRRDMTDAREFVESLKSDVFEEQVYVFTPRGKIIDLPIESTPVDFAYRIHSEIGNRCVGAKVNGKLVPLDYHLQNGDIIHVMTSKASRGPSRDWLNFVKTNSARSHIKRHFRRLEREENMVAGRNLLEKELKRLALVTSFDEIAQVNGARNPDDLFLMIGTGESTARQVVQKLLAQPTDTYDDLAHIPHIAPPPRPDASGIRVRGTGSVLTRLAKCCNPVVGEPIVGYVTRGRGVTIHRIDCRTILHERDRDRLLEVSWGDADPQGYPVPVRVESWDRVGLWRDVSSIVADAGINIEELQQIPVTQDSRTVLLMRLTIHSLNQLTALLDKLNRIPNVIEARRETNVVTQPSK